MKWPLKTQYHGSAFFESLCAYPGDFGPGHQLMRVLGGKTHSRKKTHKE